MTHSVAMPKDGVLSQDAFERATWLEQNLNKTQLARCLAWAEQTVDERAYQARTDREQGAQEMLQRIRAALRDWPTAGLDREIAESVQAITRTMRDRIATHVLGALIALEGAQ